MAEKDDKGSEKVLETARKRFKMAVDAESDNRAKELDDLKFLAASPDDNWQWPDTILKARTAPGQEGGVRPCLTINKLPQHHRQVTNEQRMNRPQIKVQPVDDRGDVEVAEIFNGIIRHIQVASEADLAFDLACDSQVAGGVGYFRILTEYCDETSFDQDIVILPIADRFKVYMDPIGVLQHPAGKRCRWAFVFEDMPKEEYEASYGEANAIDWNDAAIGDMMDWFPDKETVRIAEYMEIVETEKVVQLWRTGAVTFEGDPVPAGILAGERPIKTRKTKVPQCMWRKINGQKVLDEREMPTRYIPVIRVVGNQWIVDGKPVISGIVRNAKDAQRMYNYNASMEIELNALAPKAPYIAMAEQIEGHEQQWRNANQVPYSVLKYNAIVDEVTGQIVNVAPPARAQPAMPQLAILQAKQNADGDIKATTGQWGPSLGQPSNETSGRAIMARQREGDVGTFHYLDNHARALRYAGRIIVDMIPKVYDTRRIARILGEDGTPDHVMVDPSLPSRVQVIKDEDEKEIGKIYNLGVGKYDVVVNVGPSFTTKRAEAAEFMSQAVNSAKDPATASVLTYLAIKNQDWAGGEEAVEMLKKLLPPQVQEKPEGEGEGEQMPTAAVEMVNRLKASAGQMAGQLEVAGKALSERDAQLKEMKSKLDGRNVEAMAKMYEADKKALAEIVKAQAEVEVARVNAMTALAAQPQNTDLQALIGNLDRVLAEMAQKVAALEASTAAIAGQLQAFEIASMMPVAA